MSYNLTCLQIFFLNIKIQLKLRQSENQNENRIRPNHQFHLQLIQFVKKYSQAKPRGPVWVPKQNTVSSRAGCIMIIISAEQKLKGNQKLKGKLWKKNKTKQMYMMEVNFYKIKSSCGYNRTRSAWQQNTRQEAKTHNSQWGKHQTSPS